MTKSFSICEAFKKLSCTSSSSSVMPSTEVQGEVNYDEVKMWSVNYDRLMRNSVGRALFKRYLLAEHAEENILFWEAVETYKTSTSLDQMDELVDEIYNRFISEKAKYEISIDSKCRINLETSIINPTRCSFDEAQKQVFDNIKRDTYPRFIRSKLYADFLREQIPLEVKARFATSFDDLMSHTEGRQLFTEYLALEKADENIRFYEAVQDYKKCVNSRHRKTRAREIFKQFVSTEARTEISIDGPSREYVKNNYERGDAKLFDAAEKHIYMLMLRDCYPRFVKSQFFKKFLNIDDAEGEKEKAELNEPQLDAVVDEIE